MPSLLSFLYAQFNTPTFALDTPGGGGKRCIHSYEYYNRETGVSVYTAPLLKPGKYFMYFDPLHSLSAEICQAWRDEKKRQQMCLDAIYHSGKAVGEAGSGQICPNGGLSIFSNGSY